MWASTASCVLTIVFKWLNRMIMFVITECKGNNMEQLHEMVWILIAIPFFQSFYSRKWNITWDFCVFYAWDTTDTGSRSMFLTLFSCFSQVGHQASAWVSVGTQVGDEVIIRVEESHPRDDFLSLKEVIWVVDRIISQTQTVCNPTSKIPPYGCSNL